jgi:uncharacterized membrane protein YdfJ with MMPL/SSD domain
MAGKLYALARWVADHAGRVLAGWVLLLVVVGSLGAAFKGTLSNTFSIPGTESQQATDLLAKQFPVVNGGTVRVVFAAPKGQTVTAAPAKAAVEAGLTKAKSVHGVLAVSDPYTTGTISASKSIGYADVTFDQQPSAVPASAVDAVKSGFAPAKAAGLEVEYGGTVSGVPATSTAAEGGGILVAYLVLTITLVSLLAAGLPLLNALIGVGLGLFGVQFVSGFITLSSTTTALASMLGLAVGIDYALFILVRHRDQLRDPDTTVRESIARATGTAGSAVVFAGVTVVIALAALLVTGIPFLSAMGLGAAATVAFSVLIAITLTPALLSLAGERLRPKRASWFRRTPASGAKKVQTPPTIPLAGRWGAFVTKAPALVVVVCIAGIAVLAWPATHLRLGLPGNNVQSSSSTQHKSYTLLSEGFGPGFNASIAAVVDVRGIPSAQRAATLTTLTTKLKADPGLAVVSAPIYNSNKSVAIVSLIPKTGPDDQATTTLIKRLRTDDRALVTSKGGILYIAGVTAANIDVSQKLGASLPVYIIVIAVLAILLLILAFRSVVVPIKAVVGFLLSISASVGITVFIFQEGHFLGPLGVGAAAPILSFLPVIIIGVLFGLAMDYEVFLVSRMREAYHHTGDARFAVQEGMRESGRVVTAAALIMGSVFTSFSLAPDPIIKSIAVALTAGVLIDAFVVRMTLVPAVMHMLGSTAWAMPRWLDRIVPNVDIEGATLPVSERKALDEAQAR